jgi:hypothetical protein
VVGGPGRRDDVRRPLAVQFQRTGRVRFNPDNSDGREEALFYAVGYTTKQIVAAFHRNKVYK